MEVFFHPHTPGRKSGKGLEGKRNRVMFLLPDRNFGGQTFQPTFLYTT